MARRMDRETDREAGYTDILMTEWQGGWIERQIGRQDILMY